MAVVQIGYLGGIGPVFEDDSAGGGKYYLYQAGNMQGNGVYALYVKQPAYATNLGLNASRYVLGPYTDNQYIGAIPSFKQPVSGPNFSGFNTDVASMVSANTIPGQTGTTTTGTTTTGSGTSTGTTSTGVTTTTDNTFSAPSIMEQITTFLSNYWWLVAIILVALLWKPFLAPALGMGKRKRR